MGIPQEQQTKITEKIKEAVNRTKKRPNGIECPACGNTKFTMVDGYLNEALQEKISSDLIVGGPSLPSIASVCMNCGCTLQFNLGILGLLGEK